MRKRTTMLLIGLAACSEPLADPVPLFIGDCNAVATAVLSAIDGSSRTAVFHSAEDPPVVWDEDLVFTASAAGPAQLLDL